jgi:protein-S-isoprenylcysteine O-methyltransferase Ste14
MRMPILARVMSVVIGLVIYLGLAILGWGGLEAFFSHPALVALTIVLVVVSCVASYAGGSISSGEREDRSNRWVLIPFIVLGLAASYVSAYTDRVDFWTIDGDAARWSGVVLFGAGALLRIWPVFVLGNRFSGLVAIQPGHKLVTTGIYSVVRNPSYVGLLTSSTGWALAFRSSVGILLTAMLVPPLVARMHSEEKLLREQFGAEYEAYFARTWRLLPWIY